jgi:hypothetical protein
MSPQITDDLVQRLKQIGVNRILKKPVEPKMLRKVIREMSFPDGVNFAPSVKQRESSRLNQKGGEDR